MWISLIMAHKTPSKQALFSSVHLQKLDAATEIVEMFKKQHRKKNKQNFFKA